MTKQMISFFAKHPFYVILTYLIGGIGLGILITYPVIGSHPLRWGIGLIAICLLAHLYPLFKSK